MVAAVLLIVGLGAIGLVIAQRDLGAMARSRAHQLGIRALADARAALVGYAISYAETHSGDTYGHLPCPDVAGSGVAGAGCGAIGEAVFGRLPFATVGLADLRDGWGECLWYAVAGGAKAQPPTSPLNWDSLGQFDLLAADGKPLTDPADPHARAIAVVFAPAQPLPGQDRPPRAGGPCSGSGTVADLPAYLDGAYTATIDPTLPIRQGLTDSEVNNDLIAWIAPQDVFDQLKRRSDFPDFINAIIDNAQTALHARLGGAFCAGLEDPRCSGTIGVGRAPPAAALGLAGAAGGLHDHWRDQFWIAACTDGSACLTVSLDAAPGFACGAVLLFGGERVRGAGGQQRATASQRSDPTQYAEGINAATLTGAGGVFSGLADFAVDDPRAAASADVIRCLD